MGIGVFRINTLRPEGRCLALHDSYVLQFPGQVAHVVETVETKRAQYKQVRIKCELGFYYYLPRTYEAHIQQGADRTPKKLKSGCSACLTSCEILPDGEVAPCSGLANFSGGNVKTADLRTIWLESSNLEAIRGLASVSLSDVRHCRDCRYNFLCDASCRATAYLAYGDLRAPDPLCPYWKSAGNAAARVGPDGLIPIAALEVD